MPPWFAETSRPRPQRSTSTQPGNGRRRPGPTPAVIVRVVNQVSTRNLVCDPRLRFGPAAPECLSGGVQAAFAASGRSLNCTLAPYSLHQRYCDLWIVSERISRLAAVCQTLRDWRDHSRPTICATISTASCTTFAHTVLDNCNSLITAWPSGVPISQPSSSRHFSAPCRSRKRAMNCCAAA